MKSFNHYKMALRPRSELTTGLVLYGETEPAEMQIENLWKIVDRRTGEELADPRPDFSKFSTGDRMYPSMMKPEVKRRWDLKNYEWEETKAQHAKLRRMVHAQFMEQNPNLPVVQKLKQTTYGNEIQNEFKKHVTGSGSILKPKAFQSRQPQTGTGKSLHDELQRDNVNINKIGDEILQFLTPKTENTYAVLAVNRGENLRIKDKILVSSESNHVLKYQYDEGGRLQTVEYSGKPVEIYRYNQIGQRTYSHILGSDNLEYKYNELGQLVRAGDTTYTYDTDGDLSEKNSPEGITRYKYLKTGQLCEVHLPDGTHIGYRFDKRGFRTAKYINGQLGQRYQWKDLTTLTAVEDAKGISKFHYNEHGRCMGMERNDQVFLFATDQLGSIFTVADSSGNSVQEVLYDSFGVMIQNSSPERTLPIGFAGGLHDADTGLIHFGNREYDPATGRFISPDPLGYAGGDVDLYGYCGDDPVNFVDRLGLSDTSEASDEGAEEENTEESTENEKKLTQAKTGSKGLLDRNINKIAEGRFGKNTKAHLHDRTYKPRAEDEKPDAWLQRDRDLKAISEGKTKVVKVYMRDGLTGHLGIDIGNGEITGKYPVDKNKNLVSPDGKIKTENESDFKKVKSFRVTPEQAKKMEKTLKDKKENTTGYKLFADDCVEHVSDLLKAGGIKAPSDVTNPRPKAFFDKL